MMDDVDFNTKAQLKRAGLKLEDRNWKKSIIFYEKLLSNRLFLNDYYVYRRLIILYEKINDYRSQYEIIKTFFYNDIYCSRTQFLWIRNKLLVLIKRNFTTEKEMNDLFDYYYENGFNNKEKSNYPVIIADMIDIRDEIPKPFKESDYNSFQKRYECQQIAIGYDIQGNKEEAIKIYEKMINELGYYSYKYYQSLYFLYRDIGDYENAERILTSYFNGDSSSSDLSEKKFKRYREELEKLKNGHELNKSQLVVILPEEEDSLEHNEIVSDDLIDSESHLEDKEDIPYYDIVPEGNYFEELELTTLKDYDFHKKYLFRINLEKEYQAKIKQPLKLYEYDENLSKEENIQRKYYLKRYCIDLYFKKRFNELIELLEILKENSYFKNDCYPYRRLSNLYYELDYHDKGLNNIKELYHSGIWLNDYHYVFFCNAFRNLEKCIFIDKDEISDCFDYYKTHGALNKSKTDFPIFQADKIKYNGSRPILMVVTDENFEEEQFEYELNERALYAESKRDYENAIFYYIELVDGGTKNLRYYKKLLYCLDIVDEYGVMFDTLRYFCLSNEKRYYKTKWILDYLDLINENLSTDYTFDDLNRKD